MSHRLVLLFMLLKIVRRERKGIRKVGHRLMTSMGGGVFGICSRTAGRACCEVLCIGLGGCFNKKESACKGTEVM